MGFMLLDDKMYNFFFKQCFLFTFLKAYSKIFLGASTDLSNLTGSFTLLWGSAQYCVNGGYIVCHLGGGVGHGWKKLGS